MNIQLSDEEKIKVLNGDDLYGIMQKILLRADRIDQDREHFWIVGLANNNRILFIELIGLGSINATIAEPMDVFSFALQKRAVKIVLVHNHPSDELLPSESDKNTTDNLIQVGRIVNCHVADHLIITKNSFYSFKETGLLEKLGNSLKHVPPYKIEEQIIHPDQVVDFKVDYHKSYMRKWGAENHPEKSFEELWEIREKCISTLAER